MFLNLRVADIQSSHKDWKSKGAEFITEPKEHEREWRCYMKDPDGYIIEVGQIMRWPIDLCRREKVRGSVLVERHLDHRRLRP